MKLLLRLVFVLSAICAMAGARAAEPPTSLLDTLTLGSEPSEQSHHLKTNDSKTIIGGLGEPARQLLPRNPSGEYGGSLFFTIACDPTKPTYLIIKLWGDDAGQDRGRLLLFVDGKQLGVRHLGDVDILDILSDDPRYPGRFFYKTLPLPREMTAGKRSINLEIRGLGYLWGYGTTWDQFQRPMEKPSRGIYSVYTHVDPYFVPPAEEKQGSIAADPPVRREPGIEILDALEARVNRELSADLSSAKPLTQMQTQLLSRAYNIKWTVAFHKPQTVQRIIKALDAIYLDYVAEPRLAHSDPATYNPEWFGLGPSGNAIWMIGKELQPFLDEPLAGGNGLMRRAAWSKMLVDCRDWHRHHRRLYSNQSMINDLFGIYLANRGLEVVDAKNALPEEMIRHYLYQSVGLEPWLGNDTESGSEKPVGDHYMELTGKGLTKELGYVGAYGEVLDWASGIYDATRPAPGEEGDAKIKAQLIKIGKARAVFRHPFIDAEGNRAMALETVIGWRDVHYPGDINYTQRTTWDAGPMEIAAATLDPTLVGGAQQMLDDNQFFSLMQGRLKDGGFRVTAGLIGTPDEYELVKSQPRSGVRLPMAPGQPDFVFSDEEDGVVAIKHGDEILYASLYWRARFAINYLARVHYLTPQIERDATLWEEEKFADSGLKYSVSDRVVEAQSGRFDRYATDVKQALQGEVWPIAKIPAGVSFRPGQESVYAGKGSFYLCRYGHYLIAMNCTDDQTFDVPAPEGVATAHELVSDKDSTLGSAVKLAPRSTMVFYLN